MSKHKYIFKDGYKILEVCVQRATTGIDAYYIAVFDAYAKKPRPYDPRRFETIQDAGLYLDYLAEVNGWK